MTRPSWPEHWMNAARLAAEMSTCASGRRVGAVASAVLLGAAVLLAAAVLLSGLVAWVAG